MLRRRDIGRGKNGMTRVEIHLTEPSMTDGALLLVAEPYGHWGQVFKGIHWNGLEFLAKISAKNYNLVLTRPVGGA